jgi:preprotein translocase subunit Sec63
MVCCFGCFMWLKKFFGSPAYKREKKVTTVKLVIQIVLIILNGFWMLNTYRLIQIDVAMSGLNWEPWSALGLTPPTNYFEGFNPPEVKKTYRQLARIHHPDKVAADSDLEETTKKWLDIQKAYGCLTDRTKFDNWITYGNPDGSLLRQSVDIAMPSWLTD